MNKRLSHTPTPGALDCPVCGVYTTKKGGLAIRQLSSHVSQKHPWYRWTHRYCAGPTHDGRVVWLPLSAFNRRGGRRDDWRRECKRCELLLRERRLGGNRGLVPLTRIRPHVDELVRDLGIAGAATLASVSPSLLYQLGHAGPERQVQKAIAARLIAAAISHREQAA